MLDSTARQRRVRCGTLLSKTRADSWRRFRSAGMVLAVWIGIGCERAPVDARPETTVEAFIDRMRSVHGNPARGKLAFELLASEDKANLRERARRAGAAAGRMVGPEEMLAPSWFSLEFEPVEYLAEIRGRWSRVRLIGGNPDTEFAEARCFLEQEGWRVVVDFPALPPIQTMERD